MIVLDTGKGKTMGAGWELKPNSFLRRLVSGRRMVPVMRKWPASAGKRACNGVRLNLTPIVTNKKFKRTRKAERERQTPR